jgi:general secretion pathway protein G
LVLKLDMMLERWKLAGLALGIVAISIFAATYRVESGRWKYDRTREDMAELRIGLEQFREDNGRYPSSEEGLGVIFSLPDSGMVRGMSATGVPRDPWGNPYFYRGDGASYILGSFGPDGNGTAPDPNLLLRSN